MKREICSSVRNLIVKDRDLGTTYRGIASKYGVSKTAVEKICKKFSKFNTVDNLAGRGRKYLLSEREKRIVMRSVSVNPLKTCREIVEEQKLKVSAKTVSRVLKKGDFRSRIQKRKPFISKANRKKRLDFAKKYAHMPLSFWKKIVWSDESKFELYKQKMKRKVWLKSNENSNLKCTFPTMKKADGSLMLWGCFSWSSVGNLLLTNSTLNAEKYISLLTDNLDQSLLKMENSNNFIFQQDNAPIHKAKKTIKYFEDSNIELLEWPPQSPDLNPIENIWALLDKNITIENRRNRDEFFKSLVDAWNNLSLDVLKNLVESLPRRLEAVVKSKGGNTKY